MKKLMALLLTAVLVVGVFAACSNKQTDTDPSSTASTSTTQNSTEDTGVASGGDLDEAQYEGAASNGDLEFDYSDVPASNGNLANGD